MLHNFQTYAQVSESYKVSVSSSDCLTIVEIDFARLINVQTIADLMPYRLQVNVRLR